MLLVELITPLSFRIENRGNHHGQSDRTLRAMRDGEDVGYIDYSDYRGQPSVQMIKVPTARRQGIATAMLRRLQAEYPDTEIDLGMSTDDGSQFLNAMPSEVTANSDYANKTARLARLKRLEARYQAVAAAFDANPTEAGRQAVLKLSDKWNRLNDAIWRLENDLSDLPASKRLFR